MSRPVLVAVSGGVDSMVLLYRLAAQIPKPSPSLVVAHFNHCLRGRSSDADERFVRASARRLGLRCVVGRGDVRRRANRSGISIEMAARAMRHEFLARTARRLKIRTVALAHHADDQLELFFLRLLRGAAAGGLGGMRAESRSPADANLRLVRPLLEFSKVELRALAAGQGIRFREDASNANPDYLRNRIRHKLLPLLRKYQPALDTVVSRVMRTLGAESEFARLAAEAWLGGQAPAAFAALPVAVQRHVMEAQLLKLGLEPQFDLIETLRVSAGVPVAISPERRLVRGLNGRLAILTPRAMKYRGGRSVLVLPAFMKGTGAQFAHSLFGDLKVRAQFIGAGAARKGVAARLGSASVADSPAPQSGVEFFDANKVGPRVVLRHWRAGDRFQPIGMARPVKLQDRFVNRKVSADLRRTLVVAEAADGVLCWVEGERIGELFKLDSGTKRGLKWEWSRKPVLARGLPVSKNRATLPRN